MKSLRSEIRPMFSLAAPLVVAEVGWMAMGIVDTMMVGRLAESAVSIGGVSLGGMLYYTVTIYGGSVLLGLDTLVSQAFGAGRLGDCHRSLWSGALLAALMAIPLIAATLGLTMLLPAFGVNRLVEPVAASYATILNFGTPALLIYFVLRRYLQAMGVARPVMFALVSANLVNLAGNWVLIFGNLGFPALGTDGSAWTTVISRCYMAGVLFAALLYYNRRNQWSVFAQVKAEWERLRNLLRLGVPAATHVFLEIAVFAVATTFIARLDAVSLAAHQIALMVANVTFMVPLGISSAAAVRVGHAMGRQDAGGAGRSGWLAIAMGALFMAGAAVALTIWPRPLARLYSAEVAVIAAGVPLLRIAAIFQLFDAFQIVSAGALRGLGDTRTPMLANLVFYWGVGLPLGYWLCFQAGWGAAGIWVGLCSALVLIGSVLLSVWRYRVGELMRNYRQMPVGEKV
jgi:multidrug resistance protein, MATE family